jgi:hypothetical protein
MNYILLCAFVLSAAPAGVAQAADPKSAPAPVAKSAASPAAPAKPAATPGASATSARTPTADRGGWPDTPAGELARGWVVAFSAGEAAMKEYLAANLAAKSLETRTVPQRIERYRDLREKYGKLELASVVKSEREKLTVKLMASDATRHEFTFTAQGKAPYKLKSVAIREFGHGHGGFGH